MEQWASGKFTELNKYGTTILNAKAIGKVEMIDKIAALDYAWIESEEQDD